MGLSFGDRGNVSSPLHTRRVYITTETLNLVGLLDSINVVDYIGLRKFSLQTDTS